MKRRTNMTLTQKETTLLTDLKSQELLCIEKYSRYATMAHDPALKKLFSDISRTEQSHLSTISEIMSGTEVSVSSESPSATAARISPSPSPCTADEKQDDAYLCRDALAMEKHVSSVYDTCVFEFTSPVLRDTLAHIQKEEQNHGEMLYNYLSANGMSA